MNDLISTATVPDMFRVVRPRFQVPVMRGVIERRILVNFRCDPGTLARFVPSPFRVKVVHGCGVAGICLIRLSGLRPAFLPSGVGLSSEDSAHRIAVEWNDEGVGHEGVFIPRRDTNSRLNRLAGGRLFPGVHHSAKFEVMETGVRFKLRMRSDDGTASVRLLGRTGEGMAPGSIFRSLEEASEFFRSGALGWSARPEPDVFDGLELRCHAWRLEPLTIDRVESSFFSDTAFPRGRVEFDSAFLMRGLQHEWRTHGRMIRSAEVGRDSIEQEGVGT